MNWDAIGAVGEIVGAMSAIREIILATASNDALRVGQMKDWGLEGYYESRASELGIDIVEASRNDWANAVYFWMYWGQWVSSHEQRDLTELEHILIKIFSISGVRHTWDVSPLGKAFLDEEFVQFVDDILVRNSV